MFNLTSEIFKSITALAQKEFETSGLCLKEITVKLDAVEVLTGEPLIENTGEGVIHPVATALKVKYHNLYKTERSKI